MSNESKSYEFSQIEPKWQAYWDNAKTFRAENGSPKPKFYALDMFPYPSGAGLHVGHPEGYTATDILSRYWRAQGKNVLHPMGWDAFGLPAEQYAIQTGTHPRETTAKNIDRFRAQIKRIGFAIDWSREIDTTDPRYYRWTQWIFLNLFKHGLAYVDKRPVWWSPDLGAVLANEEVVNGRSERGNYPVERRQLRQWVLRITAYADRLLDDLAGVDWPDSTKRMQAAWIGRSEGAEVVFELADFPQETITVFTTRPDTLFGATYMVLAPEHPLVKKITTPEQTQAVEGYVKQAASKSDLDRTDLAKEKTGVFTGAYAVNPVNGQKIPIWVADYVLLTYGTGAIMAVPAHDERDFEFAKTFHLPIIEVVRPKEGSKEAQDYQPGDLFAGVGVMVNSGEYDGVDSNEAKQKIVEKLAAQNKGKGAVNYKLRDWLFSRQRYWGEPIPILWVDKAAYDKATADRTTPVGAVLPETPVSFTEDGQSFYAIPTPLQNLPLLLPETEHFKPTGMGESPLAALTDWVEVWLNLKTGETRSRSHDKPAGDDWAPARRETNTMPQWAGSCWYHLRYCDPGNDQALIGEAADKYWGSPDIYIGGAEHAVLHLLYARFWHKFLFDIGVVHNSEPYRRLFHQGIILGEDGNKMSKSIGNVINPDEVINAYGADSFRLYEMFMGPLQDMKPWSTKNIEGVFRFLRRSWRELVGEDGKPAAKYTADKNDPELEKLLHQSIKKVTQDIEGLRFNTAISQLMILLNALQKQTACTRETATIFIRLLAPFAPHICEELWEIYGEPPSVAAAPWPQWDESKLGLDSVTVAVQVNGKLRGELSVSKDASASEVGALAKQLERVAASIEGKQVVKEIYVPGKIYNIVVK